MKRGSDTVVIIVCMCMSAFKDEDCSVVKCGIHAKYLKAFVTLYSNGTTGVYL